MLKLYAPGRLLTSSSEPEEAIASCQEGQAWTFTGMAKKPASTAIPTIRSAVFMTFLMIALF